MGSSSAGSLHTVGSDQPPSAAATPLIPIKYSIESALHRRLTAKVVGIALVTLGALAALVFIPGISEALKYGCLGAAGVIGISAILHQYRKGQKEAIFAPFFEAIGWKSRDETLDAFLKRKGLKFDQEKRKLTPEGKVEILYLFHQKETGCGDEHWLVLYTETTDEYRREISHSQYMTPGMLRLYLKDNGFA